MASIKSYTQNGTVLFEVRVSIGRDELTGVYRQAHKRGFKNKKEATLWASRLTLDADSDDLTKRKRLRFRDVFEQWDLAYVNDVTESTYAKTRGMFDKHILPLFGNKLVNEITTAQLQKAVNKWSKEVTRNYKKWFNRASSVLKYAVEQGYIANNPAKRVKVPKMKRMAGDKPENFWDRAALISFFTYIDPKTAPQKYALFRVLAFGGLRRGEVLALTWADIDFSNGSVRINKTLTQGLKGRQIVQAPKTRKSRRTVPLDGKTMAALQTWRVKQMQVYMAKGINTNKPGQLVFATRKNTHMYLYQPAKWLKAIEDKDAKADKPKLPHTITVHGFRHSHASALFAAGVQPKEVQERLGHEDIQTTLNIYTHVTEAQTEEAAKKVANYLNF